MSPYFTKLRQALFAAAGLVALCSSCAGTVATLGKTPAGPGPAFASLGNPQTLLTVADKHASDATTPAIDAAGFDAALPYGRVVISGTELTLAPSFTGSGALGGNAFAIFSFDLAAAAPEALARLIWAGPPPAAGLAWLGLADLIGNRWVWFAVDAAAPCDFGSLQRYKDAASGKLMLAVVVGGSDIVTLRRVRLGSAQIAGQPPLQDHVDFGSPIVFPDLSGYGVPGSVASFDFDWDGDGTYDLLDQGASATPSHEYFSTQTGKIRYHNDEGLSQELSFTVQPVNGWSSYTLAGGAGVLQCYQPRLALVGGQPAIAYLAYNELLGTQNLLFRRASGVLLGDWDAAQLAQGASPASRLSRLQEVDGTAALAYNDLEGNCQYLRAVVPDGSSWHAALTALSATGPDETPDLQLIDGRPAVASIEGATAFVAYRRADDAAGGAWAGPSYVIAATAELESEITLDTFQGLPLLCFRNDEWTFNIMQGSLASGMESPWAAKLQSRDTGNGGYLSFGAQHGRPLLLYNSTYFDHADLRISHAPTADGSGEWEDKALWVGGAVENPGYYCKYAELTSWPRYAGVAVHYDIALGSLSAVMFDHSTGEAETLNMPVDSSADVGSDCSLIIYNNLPVIAYEDATNGTIKIAVLQ